MHDNVPWYFAVSAAVVLTAIYLLQIRHAKKNRQKVTK